MARSIRPGATAISAPEMPLFAGSPTSKAGRVGTGLGLPLPKRLVELHQDIIRVESRPGEGSVFRVELPVDAATAAQRQNGAVR